MILALCGEIGSGKSTIAKWLRNERGFAYVPFAKPLKDMLAALGLTPDELYGGSKQLPSKHLCGATPRHAMQTLGTEWGRGLIHPNLWINAWALRVAEALDLGENIVVDDLRFLNEAKAVRTMHGKIWRVVRGNTPLTTLHVSEIEWREITIDRVVHNNGTREETFAAVEEILSHG